MMSPDPLAQLHDIVLPAAVSWWPLAWGWWVLLLLILSAIGAVLYIRRRNRQREAYRLLALHELNRITTRYQEHGNTAEYLQQLSLLLRRTALSAQPQRFPVEIKGEAWLRWLDDHCPATGAGFTTGCGRVLLTGPYEANPTIDRQQLEPLVRLWLQQHRNQWQKTHAPAPQKMAQQREVQDA